MKKLHDADERSEVQQLFKNLVEKLPVLEELLTTYSDDMGYEDPFYRFYHQSYKVYNLQYRTKKIVAALQSLRPGEPLNKWFMQIVQEGTVKTFSSEDNE